MSSQHNFCHIPPNSDQICSGDGKFTTPLKQWKVIDLTWSYPDSCAPALSSCAPSRLEVLHTSLHAEAEQKESSVHLSTVWRQRWPTDCDPYVPQLPSGLRQLSLQSQRCQFLWPSLCGRPKVRQCSFLSSVKAVSPSSPCDEATGVVVFTAASTSITPQVLIGCVFFPLHSPSLGYSNNMNCQSRQQGSMYGGGGVTPLGVHPSNPCQASRLPPHNPRLHAPPKHGHVRRPDIHFRK